MRAPAILGRRQPTTAQATPMGRARPDARIEARATASVRVDTGYVAPGRSVVAPVVGRTLEAAPVDTTGVVRWNTFILGTGMALAWAVIQLQASLVAITTERLTGQTTTAGIGPAIFTAALGLAALPTGRLMDAWGRVPGISGGFLVATVGAGLVFAGTGFEQLPLFLVGLAVLGCGLGAVQLSRAGAADMYPAERRATGIGRVLLGAAVGAILSPIIFGPLLRDRGADSASLAAPWLVAATITALGAGIAWAIRVDPLVVGRWIQPDVRAAPRGGLAAPARRPIRAIFAQRGPRAALIAAVAAQVVMVSAMSLVSLEMRHHGHDLGGISIALGAHFLGMFGLSPVMGRAVDRIGRRNALVLGLGVLATSVAAMPLSAELFVLVPVMFFVGIGWNIAYVAATALIADGTDPAERGQALGAADLAALFSAAVGAVVAAAILGIAGLAVVTIIAAILAVLPAIYLIRPFRARPIGAGA